MDKPLGKLLEKDYLENFIKANRRKNEVPLKGKALSKIYENKNNKEERSFFPFKGFKSFAATTIILSFVVLLTACGKKENPQDAFEVYKASWQNKDFKAMYTMVSQSSKAAITEEDFIKRYTNIYEGIEAKDINITATKMEDLKQTKEENVKIPFSIKMNTLAGTVEIPGYEVTLAKEKVEKKNTWKVVWNERLIFPYMEPGDKVRAEVFHPNRGEIYDRSGTGLAVNSKINSVGIHPRLFEEDKENKIIQMAKLLDIKPEVIEGKLKGNTNPDYFVPIVKVASKEKEKVDYLLQINGVKVNEEMGRVYPGEEACGALIGYVGAITAEELEKVKDQGYNEYSLIGKKGLEQVYEKRLKGEAGGRIYIERGTSEKKEVIEVGKKEPKDGENIKVSIDLQLQKKIYEEMNKESGAAVAAHPKTGEVLAMVSSPSYDSNVFSTYTTDTQKAAWEATPVDEFDNKFNNSYSPGSTFKLITGAIGLNKGVIKPEEGVNIQGNQWQPSNSWGNYKITRVKDPGKPVNLRDAFKYSDNIYFGMAALNIGKEDFAKGAMSFGIGEELPFEYPMENTQVANENKISKDILLGDTGYGQGEVLMTPLHLALAYSSLVNEGNLLAPALDITQGHTAKVWKANAISTENISPLVEGIKAVVADPEGTGHEGYIEGITIGGKTGTAELKKSAEDKEGKENGLFVALNLDDPKIVVSMVIEDVKSRGGSHLVVPKVKNILEYYLKRS